METLTEESVLELARHNLVASQRNYAHAVKNLEESMKHMLTCEATVERLEEEAREKPF